MAHKPFARGVTQLMYVGDVPTSPNSGDATTLITPTTAAVVIGIGVLFWWLDGGSRRKRR